MFIMTTADELNEHEERQRAWTKVDDAEAMRRWRTRSGSEGGDGEGVGGQQSSPGGRTGAWNAPVGLHRGREGRFSSANERGSERGQRTRDSRPRGGRSRGEGTRTLLGELVSGRASNHGEGEGEVR